MTEKIEYTWEGLREAFDRLMREADDLFTGRVTLPNLSEAKKRSMISQRKYQIAKEFQRLIANLPETETTIPGTKSRAELGVKPKEEPEQRKDLYEYLVYDLKIDEFKAHQIATTLDIADIDETDLRYIGYVLAYMPLDEQGKIFPTKEFPSFAGRDFRDLIRYSTSPEGKELAFGLIDDYWARGRQSTLWNVQTNYPLPQYKEPKATERMMRVYDPRFPEGKVLVPESEFRKEQFFQRQYQAVEQQRKMREYQAWERGGGVTMRPAEAPGRSQLVSAGLERLEREGKFTSPAMKAYYERQLPYLYEEAGMPQAMRRWAESGAGRGITEEPEEPEEPEMEEGMTPSVYYRKKARWRERMQAYELGKTSGGKDPWGTFLSQYPFLEKYKALSPAEKGEYPSRFRPRTRFLG